MNDVGMNLAQRDQRPTRSLSTFRPAMLARDHSEFLKKSRPVALNRGLRIIFSEAEIQVPVAVSAGEARDPR